MYHDNSSSRSPGSQRHQSQTLHRQSSRQFDAYGPMPTGLYPGEDHLGRFEPNRIDRLNPTMPSGTYGYEMQGAHTWNPSGFGGPHTLGGMGGTSRMKPSTRGRTGLPTTWLDPQSGLPGLGHFSGLGPSPLAGPQMRPDSMNPETDDELIPTAIVIKNIPFAVKKEQLVQLMTEMNLPLPYAFNYHFDNGVFRGLAFANFTSADETATVIENLNHFELQGRKLRVEYKKMLPLQERERIEREKRERRGQLEEQHRPIATSQLHSQNSMSSLSSHIPNTSPSPVSSRNPKLDVDLNDPQTLQFYSSLLLFKDDYSREALIFPSTLTPPQRRIVHTLAHHMQLQHTSRGNGEQRQVHVYRPAQGTNVSPPIPPISTTMNAGDASRRGLNRAATIDFSEARSSDSSQFNTLRGQSSGFLGVLDSPGGFGNSQNLRAAKSFADLRSYTPSPVPSSASFPTALQSNGTRYQQEYGPGGSAASNTPTLTPTASGSALGSHRDENPLISGFGGMSIGTGITGPNSGSPRRLRGMFSWDQESPHPSTAPIGSNRSVGVGFDNQAQATRQSRNTERGGGFRRQNGHQGRGSDELRSNSNVEIIVE